MSTSALSYANDFLSFINASPTPYHAVQNVKQLLKTKGFTELSEHEQWAGKIIKGNKYFVTRNGSSIISFTVGGKWEPGNGVSIVGAHTDSPTLRIKPNSKKTAAGYLQVGVEVYGGGIWHSWFDRDLSVAGRVLVKDKESGKISPKLCKIERPILRIPTLAIHLDREVNTKFVFNKESQLYPIAGLAESILNNNKGKEEPENEDEFHALAKITDRHNPHLLDVIADDIGVSVPEIEDFELVLYDTQPSQLGGLSQEFIFSPRLDNLTSCYTAITGLVQSTSNLDKDNGIQLVCLFDHEEIGSASAQGADSSFLPDILERIVTLKGEYNDDPYHPVPESFVKQTIQKSLLVSSDMAHGVHPNYVSNYESNHQPQLNKGPVIKINANQRYATNSPGIILLKEVAEKVKVPLQLFVVKNDSPCGSTIGPIIASKLGLRTIDIGAPQLSMHSIRETCGSHDIELSIKLFQSFFESYSSLHDNFIVDAL